MKNEFTVLSDWSSNGDSSHREIAEDLLPKMEEEMTDDEYNGDLKYALQRTVLDLILQDLSANLADEDWRGMGFEKPEHFLNAENVSIAISDTVKWYLEDDQTGKSGEILQVIMEYAEKCNLGELPD